MNINTLSKFFINDYKGIINKYKLKTNCINPEVFVCLFNDYQNKILTKKELKQEIESIIKYHQCLN